MQRAGAAGAKIAQFRASRSGTVAILSCCAMTILVGALALAIDLGALYIERRQLQGVVDLAAVVAAADIGRATSAAEATLKANNIHGGRLTVQTGTYVATSSLSREQRFTEAALPLNAVRVSFERPGRAYFARALSIPSLSIQVRATASSGRLAMFSIGSRLASVRGGAANQILSALLGGSVSLTALDYDTLASADIEVVSLLRAISAQTSVRGTYGDVLASSIQVSQILSAMATVAQNSGQMSASYVLNSLRGQVGRSSTVALSRVIDAGPLAGVPVATPVPGFTASVKAMDVIAAASLAVDRGTQVSVTISNLPGLAHASLDVAIGEPMQTSGWSTVGEPGATVSTAQIRLRLTASLGGTGLLSGSRIVLPITLEVARARARLVDISCTPSGGTSVALAVSPSVAQATIGNSPQVMTDFTRALGTGPATLLDTPLLRVRAAAYATIGNTSETGLTFRGNEIGNGTIKRTATRNAAETLFSTLLGNMSLTVDALGLQLSAGGIADALKAALAAASPTLDDVLFSALSVLGIQVGEADVTVQGAVCSGAGRLAQ